MRCTDLHPAHPAQVEYRELLGDLEAPVTLASYGE